ncbi:hypothetical protein ACFWJV_30340 [Streptomyces rochei]|uniref:hypothetical protein n=1 Tax=Streptomyces rochei TaxID=1928 RepID=UPI0013C09730|nr:hypothetical protein [Streptomyces diastaticus]
MADFLRVYTRYATGVCLTAGDRTQAAAVLAWDTGAATSQQEAAHVRFVSDHAEVVARAGELEGYRDELEATVAGIRLSSEYKAALESRRSWRRLPLSSPPRATVPSRRRLVPWRRKS